MTQRANLVAALRRSVAKLDGTQERLTVQSSQVVTSLGVDDIDALLGGGFLQGNMHEVRCTLSRDIGCTIGFLLGVLYGLTDKQPIVWLSEPSADLDTGMLFPGGISHLGLDPSRIACIRPPHLADCFWAAGEALRTGGLAAVVLHLKGNPNTFDLSISRKLMLRAQTSGIPLFTLRQAGAEEASSAATRWHIKPSPSLPNEIYPKGLGHMRLTLTLEKNRNGQTGQWLIAWNPQTRSFEHAANSSQHRSGKTTTQSTHSSLPFHPSVVRQDNAAEMG